MIFLIYTILVVLQQYKGTSTVASDPCLSDISKRSAIVVDMCKSSNATEEKLNGNDKVDSVVLRIMMQQDDCICRVNIENQIEVVYIGLGKYGSLTSSAPVNSQCGLAVDINHIPDMSTGNVIAPIECIDNVDFRSIPLSQNSTLQFKSRIINGTFTRGYCMRIHRDRSSDPAQVLRIDCEAPMTTERTTTISTQATESVISSTMRTTRDVTISDPTTDTSEQFENPSMTTDPTTGTKQTTHIAIGVGSGVALILLVVFVVVCLRKRSTQKAGTNGNVKKTDQQEESVDKLPNNVLYVPAGDFDITGGNYSTADVDTANSSQNRLGIDGDYSTVDVDTPRSSNKRLNMESNYSTVDDDTPRSSDKRLNMESNYNTVDANTRKSPKNRLNMEGNYSTVELDEHLERNCSYPENSEPGQAKGKQKPTIKPKPKSSCINSQEHRLSDRNIKHVAPPNGSDNVYAIVDKRSKNVPTTNGSKGEGTCQPDQTYAVVDKAGTRKSDETNKKKFEINFGNRVKAM